jgi:hypothetical protein
MNETLNYEEKCACAKSNFCIYVNNSEQFGRDEKNHLVRAITDKGFSGILYVSSVLAAWAAIAGVIDSVLFPGIIVYAIFHGVIDYKVLTPPILFLVGNIVAKFIYISYSLRGKVKLKDVVIAALPYAGSAYLLRKFLIRDELMRKAVSAYLLLKKKELKDKFLKLFSSK